MRSSLLTLSFVATAALGTAAQPQGPLLGNALQEAAGLTAASSEATVSRVSPPPSKIGYIPGLEGNPILLLKVANPGKGKVRLHVENLRLPEGAELFVYGLDSSHNLAAVSGPYQSASLRERSDLWTEAIASEYVFVELQLSGDVPADMPFEVTEIKNEQEESGQSVGAPASTEQVTVRSTTMGDVKVTYEVQEDLAVFEGDIILGRPDELEQNGKSSHRDSLGANGSRFRWPNGTIPYGIDSDIPNQGRIIAAIQHWNTLLSGVIQLVPRKNEYAYVQFQRGPGCSGYVGMQGSPQSIFMGDSCTSGNAIHEIGHAVGLWHEQSRSDRDKYINILWANISPSQAYNYDRAYGQASNIGAYDYNSIMHYTAYAFSSNGNTTIQTIPPGIPIGQRLSLSAGDIAGVISMYGGSTGGGSGSTGGGSGSTGGGSGSTGGGSGSTGGGSGSTGQGISVTLDTNPSGLQVKADGQVFTSPASVNWQAGTSHTIEALDDVSGGVGNQFVSWSDSGSQAHTVIASNNTRTYKADYKSTYQISATANPSYAGQVTISPASDSGYYPLNTRVYLSAAPANGYCFSGWTGGLSGAPSYTYVTASKPIALQADFQRGSLSLTSTQKSFTSAGGVGIVGISATSGCGWRAAESVNWMYISSGSSGMTSGTMYYIVSPNLTGVPRQTVITINGQPHTVYQSED